MNLSLVFILRKVRCQFVLNEVKNLNDFDNNLGEPEDNENIGENAKSMYIFKVNVPEGEEKHWKDIFNNEPIVKWANIYDGTFTTYDTP